MWLECLLNIFFTEGDTFFDDLSKMLNYCDLFVWYKKLSKLNLIFNLDFHLNFFIKFILKLNPQNIWLKILKNNNYLTYGSFNVFSDHLLNFLSLCKKL